jgi:hypothetical protein
MRKVSTGAFVSLDGVMQAPGGPEEVVMGDHAMDPPTPGEIARRERMKREG